MLKVLLLSLILIAPSFTNAKAIDFPAEDIVCSARHNGVNSYGFTVTTRPNSEHSDVEIFQIDESGTVLFVTTFVATHSVEQIGNPPVDTMIYQSVPAPWGEFRGTVTFPAIGKERKGSLHYSSFPDRHVVDDTALKCGPAIETD